MKFITINWEKLNIMEIYLHIDSNFFDRFIKTYNPEIMRNFPYKKFNRYVFISYIIRKNFVLIKTALGTYHFRWVKSLNTTVSIHGENVLLTNPPEWIQIVHLVETK
jgi:hypothetical protein